MTTSNAGSGAEALICLISTLCLTLLCLVVVVLTRWSRQQTDFVSSPKSEAAVRSTNMYVIKVPKTLGCFYLVRKRFLRFLENYSAGLFNVRLHENGCEWNQSIDMPNCCNIIIKCVEIYA